MGVPNAIEVPEDGALRFAIAASTTNVVTARVHVRIFGVIRRPINFTFAHSAGDRTVEAFTMTVPEGAEIVGMNVFIDPGVKRGQAYIRCHLMNRAQTMQLLGRGYVYDGSDWFLGQDDEPGPGGGEGFVHTVTGSNPAAGAEVSESVPTNAVWRLIAFSAVLVADGNTANRIPRLVIDDGAIANRYFLQESDTTNPVTASETRTQLWMRQGGSDRLRKEVVDTQSVNTMRTLDSSSDRLQEGDRIRTVTTGILAGDDYAAPLFMVEEWLVV